MDVSTIASATRGETLVALFRVALPNAPAPDDAIDATFLVLFRLDHGGRIEQWSRATDNRGEAVELYTRGVEDFITPIDNAQRVTS